MRRSLEFALVVLALVALPLGLGVASRSHPSACHSNGYEAGACAGSSGHGTSRALVVVGSDHRP
jgi:hypothetical protein